MPFRCPFRFVADRTRREFPLVQGRGTVRPIPLRGKDLELAPRRPHGRTPMKRGSLDAPRRDHSRFRHDRLRKAQS